METATLAGGCFWCTEAVFQRLDGVHRVVPGYTGGHVENPTYAQVCGKQTGHAEAVQVEFDPETVSFAELLEVFFKTHDPTTPDRQGHDVGPQYRSGIFYHSTTQKETAEAVIEALDASGAFDAPIVTEVTAFERFYPAEPEHHDFYARNPDQAYCNAVIRPKIDALERAFRDELR